MVSGLSPKEWNLITEQILDLSGRAELAMAKTKVQRARRELLVAKEELAEVRRRRANRGRVLVKPTGKRTVSAKEIREALR